MATMVHKSYEAYVRGEGGILLETGRHVLIAGDPEPGMEVKLRYSPAWVATKVLSVEGTKIVVDPFPLIQADKI